MLAELDGPSVVNFLRVLGHGEYCEVIDALVNTYWVRFDHRLFTHGQAVSDTKILCSAAKKAGVRRIIRVSITRFNGTSDVPLKALGISSCVRSVRQVVPI